MQSFKDIINVHRKYIDYLVEKTLLTHQYAKNIDQTGYEVEEEVRQLLKNILPERYKVTHGYIVSAPAQNTEPLISPQVDIIIVDTLVPHSLFIIDKKGGMEVVPIEAVIGIFEVKRTLSKRTLSNSESPLGALYHLRNIIDSVGITKTNNKKYLPGGIELNGLEGGFSSNPLVGILGIITDSSINTTEKINKVLRKESDLFILPELDIIGGLDNFITTTSFSTEVGTKLTISITRQENADTHYGVLSNNQNSISYIFGFILWYLSNTTGRSTFLASNYFFNASLEK